MEFGGKKMKQICSLFAASARTIVPECFDTWEGLLRTWTGHKQGDVVFPKVPKWTSRREKVASCFWKFKLLKGSGKWPCPKAVGNTTATTWCSRYARFLHLTWSKPRYVGYIWDIGGLIHLSIHSLLSNCLEPQCSQKKKPCYVFNALFATQQDKVEFSCIVTRLLLCLQVF